MHWPLALVFVACAVLLPPCIFASPPVYFSVYHLGAANINEYSFTFTDGSNVYTIASPSTYAPDISGQQLIGGLNYNSAPLGVDNSLPPGSWACTTDLSSSLDINLLYSGGYHGVQTSATTNITESLVFSDSNTVLFMAPKRTVLSGADSYCGVLYCESMGTNMWILSSSNPCQPNSSPYRMILTNVNTSVVGYGFVMYSDDRDYIRSGDPEPIASYQRPDGYFGFPSYSQFFYNRQLVNESNPLPAGASACSSDMGEQLLPTFLTYFSVLTLIIPNDQWPQGNIINTPVTSGGGAPYYAWMMAPDVGNATSATAPATFDFKLNMLSILPAVTGSIVMTRDTGVISAMCGNPLCSTPCPAGEYCVGPDTCGCYEGSCSNPLCLFNCQNNGTCNAVNHTCSCLSGWAGDSCTEAVCEFECQHNGFCNGPNECYCVGSWKGPSCNISTCSVTCQHGGRCSGDECNCASTGGWGGPSCSVPTCTTGCAFGCTTPYTCDCQNGYYGPTCTNFDCNAIGGCGEGTCVSPNVCDCSSTNYTGDSCEIFIKPLYFCVYNVDASSYIDSYSIMFGITSPTAPYKRAPVVGSPSSYDGSPIDAPLFYNGLPVGVNGNAIPPQSWACSDDLRYVIDKKAMYTTAVTVKYVFAHNTDGDSGVWSPQIGEQFYLVTGMLRSITNDNACFNTICNSLDHFFVLTSESPVAPDPNPYTIIINYTYTDPINELTLQFDQLNYDYTVANTAAEVGTPIDLASSVANFFVNGAPLSAANPLTTGNFACTSDLGAATLPILLSRLFYVIFTNPAGRQYKVDYNAYVVKKKRDIVVPFRYVTQISVDDQDFEGSPCTSSMSSYVVANNTYATYEQMGTIIMTRDPSPYCPVLCTTCTNGSYCVAPGVCQCFKDGYTGDDCHQICGFYPNGTQYSDCVHGHCNGTVGSCVCDVGYTGSTCSIVQSASNAPGNVSASLDPVTMVITVKWSAPSYLGQGVSYIGSYMLEMNNGNNKWTVVSSSITSTNYFFPPSASIPLAGKTLTFRVTAKSFGGNSLPSPTSPPLLVSIGSVRDISSPYMMIIDTTARFFGTVNTIGTESITCDFHTTASGFDQAISSGIPFGWIKMIVPSSGGTNTLTVTCSSSLGSLFAINPCTTTFVIAGGFYSVPTDIGFAWDAPLGPALNWSEPVGALVQRYDTTWTASGIKVSRSYPMGTTYLYCEDFLYTLAYGSYVTVAINTILTTGTTTLPISFSFYWGGPPPPPLIYPGSVFADSYGLSTYVTVTPFPLFHYRHNALFSFTMQYAVGASGNANNPSLVWQSPQTAQSIQQQSYVNQNLTGYIGGRIPNPPAGQAVYVRVFGTAAFFPNGEPSSPLEVSLITSPDCSGVAPVVSIVLEATAIGANVTWGNCRDVGAPADFYQVEIIVYGFNPTQGSLATNTTNHFAYFSGLKQNAQLGVRVVAVNSTFGYGAYSSITTFNVRPPPAKPPTPIQPTVTYNDSLAIWSVSSPSALPSYPTGGINTTVTLNWMQAGVSVVPWQTYKTVSSLAAPFSYNFQIDTGNLAGFWNFSYQLTATSSYGITSSDAVTISLGGPPATPVITNIVARVFTEEYSTAGVYWTSGVRSRQDIVEYNINDEGWVIGSNTTYPGTNAYLVITSPGATVQVRIQSTNLAGDSDYAESDPILVAEIPQWYSYSAYQPTFGSFEADGVTVSWPAYSGLTGAPVYYLLRAYDETYSNPILVANTTSTNATVNDLPLSHTYYFTVSPANIVGEGNPSAFSLPCSLFETPAVVANISLTLDNGLCYTNMARRPVEFDIVWSPSSGYPVSYTLQFSYDENFAESVYTYEGVACCSRRSCAQPDMDIVLGQTLYARAQAVNYLGSSPWSNSTSVLFVTAPGQTSIPTVVSLERYSNGTTLANLTWDAMDTGDANLYYRLWLLNDTENVQLLDNIVDTWAQILLQTGIQYSIALQAVSPLAGDGPIGYPRIFYTGSTPDPVVVSNYSQTSNGSFSATTVHFILHAPEDDGGFPLFPSVYLVYYYGTETSNNSQTYTYQLDTSNGASISFRLGSGYYGLSAFCSNQLGNSPLTVILPYQSFGVTTLPAINLVGSYSVTPMIEPSYQCATLLLPNGQLAFSITLQSNFSFSAGEADPALTIVVQKATLTVSDYEDWVVVPMAYGPTYLSWTENATVYPNHMPTYSFRAFLRNGLGTGDPEAAQPLVVPAAAPPTLLRGILFVNLYTTGAMVPSPDGTMWGYNAWGSIAGPIGTRNGDYSITCRIFFPLISKTTWQTVESDQVRQQGCEFAAAYVDQLFVPFATVSQLNSGTPLARTVVQIEAANSAGPNRINDGYISQWIDSSTLYASATQVIVNGVTLIDDLTLNISLSRDVSQTTICSQFFVSITVNRLSNTFPGATRTLIYKNSFAPVMNLSADPTYVTMAGIALTIYQYYEVILTNSLGMQTTVTYSAGEPLWPVFPKILPALQTIRMLTTGGTTPIIFQGMDTAISAFCLFVSNTTGLTKKTSIAEYATTYTAHYVYCARPTWPYNDTALLYTGYSQATSTDYWIVNVYEPVDIPFWPRTIPWGDWDFTARAQNYIYLNVPSFFDTSDFAWRVFSTDNSTGYYLLASNNPAKGPLMIPTGANAPSPPVTRFQYSAWGSPWVTVSQTAYYFSSPPQLLAKYYDNVYNEQAGSLLMVWLVFYQYPQSIPTDDIVIRFMSTDGTFYTDFPPSYFICPNYVYNDYSYVGSANLYCIGVVPYLLPWVNYQVQVSWNGGYFFTPFPKTTLNAYGNVNKAINFLASDIAAKSNPLVTRCLSYPCDQCQAGQIAGCAWIKLGTGTRLCASTAIAIYGSTNATDCSLVDSELLPGAARNQMGFVIRQDPAPNNNYATEVTFPIGLYFDHAPNNNTATYTCAVTSGGVGWTLLTTTAQSTTVYSTSSSLQAIYNIPKYAMYIAPECRFLRPTTSLPSVTINFTVTFGNPAQVFQRIESFDLRTEILSYTPYLATAVPTGGVFLQGYNYTSAVTTVTVNLPGVVALTVWILDGVEKVRANGFISTYDVDYPHISVGRHNITVIVDANSATRIFEVDYFPSFIESIISYLNPVKPLYKIEDMPGVPGFMHQSWTFNIPTPMYNAITDVGSAPLGLGGKYGANMQIILGFDWYTTGAFTCTGGGGGGIVVKDLAIFALFQISVTMYRPQSGGLDLQEVDVAMTAGIVIPLLDEGFSVPIIGVGIKIQFTIGVTMTLRAKIANTKVVHLTGLYLPLGNDYAITGGGTVSIPLQLSVSVNAFGGSLFNVFAAGAPFVSLDCQAPFIISAIGISFAVKVSLPWLDIPGINSFTLVSFSFEQSFDRKRNIMLPTYDNTTSLLDDFEDFDRYPPPPPQYIFNPQCHWQEEFVRGHAYVRQLPNLDDGILHEVRLINDTYPSSYVSLSQATGLGSVMQLWIGQDDVIPYPSSSTLMWSIYSSSSGQWSTPSPLSSSPYMDGVPYSIVFSTTNSTFAALWTRVYGEPANATAAAYLDPSADTAEVVISFYTPSNTWTTPINLTNNNQFDGAVVAAVFTPTRNPLPNLLVMWIHKPTGGLIMDPTTDSDVMYMIYTSNNKWSTPGTITSGINISYVITSASGDDTALVGYGITNTDSITQLFVNVYMSNVSLWSTPFRVAHLPNSDEGILENGTGVAYDDSLGEALLTVAYVNAQYMFAWYYNQTILYRTWSPATGGGQIYSITPEALPIAFLQLVASGSTVVLVAYVGTGATDQPGYYTVYELLPSSTQFGLPSTLQGYTGYSCLALSGTGIVQDQVQSVLISMVQRQVYPYNDSNSNTYVKVDAAVTYQVIPLQHNILLQTFSLAQTSAVQGVLTVIVVNNGTSMSPSDGSVVVSFYETGSTDLSSSSTLIGSFSVPAIQSTALYSASVPWNISSSYLWVEISGSSISRPTRTYRFPIFTPSFDLVNHATSILAPGVIKLQTSVINSLTVFPALSDLEVNVTVSMYNTTGQTWTKIQSIPTALSSESSTAIATAVDALSLTGKIRFSVELYPDTQPEVEVSVQLVANVTFDLEADYYVDSTFNQPLPDLAIDPTLVQIVTPFVGSAMLYLIVENNGQLVARNTSVSVYLNTVNATSSDYDAIRNITGDNSSVVLADTNVGDIQPLQTAQGYLALPLTSDGIYNFIILVSSWDPTKNTTFQEWHPIDNADVVSFEVYPQLKFVTQSQYLSVDPTTGAVSLAIINNLNESISYSFSVDIALNSDNTSSSAVTVATLNFDATFDAYSCDIVSSSNLPEVLAALEIMATQNSTNATTTYFLIYTIPALVSGQQTPSSTSVPLISTVGVALPDCSIPFTEVKLTETPPATVYIGDVFTKNFSVKAHSSVSFVSPLKPSDSQFVDNGDNTATFTFSPTFADISYQSNMNLDIEVSLTDGFTLYSNTTLALNVIACRPPQVFCPTPSPACVATCAATIATATIATATSSTTSAPGTTSGTSSSGTSSPSTTSNPTTSAPGTTGTGTSSSGTSSPSTTSNPTTSNPTTSNPTTSTPTTSNPTTSNPGTTSTPGSTSGSTSEATTSQSSTTSKSSTSAQSSTTQSSTSTPSTTTTGEPGSETGGGGNSNKSKVGIAVGVTIGGVALIAALVAVYVKKDSIRAWYTYRRAPSVGVELDHIPEN